MADPSLKTWEKADRIDFIKKCKNYISSCSGSLIAIQDDKLTDILNDIYSLMTLAVKGSLKKDAIISVLNELSMLHPDMNSFILDMFNVFDVETSLLDQNAKERVNLSAIIKASELIVTEKLMKERLEIDSLQEMKILTNRNFYSKFIKVKTKLYYKQRKFNLFREESEGFSKLIVDLMKAQNDGESPTECLENVKSLIGCFNLDPNRVLDVILELFEQHTSHYSFYIPLIQAYMPDPKILCEVLGFKFTSYHNSTEPTRRSLFQLTATMLQHGIIHLDDVYIWLIPDDKIIVKDFEKELSNAKEYVRKLNIVSTKEKEDKEDERKDKQIRYEMNQKFGLAEAMLQIGDWNTFIKMSDKLVDYCLVDQPPIGLALCNLISRMIEPVYRKHSGLGPKVKGCVMSPFQCSLTLPPCQTFEDFQRTVLPMLNTLGPSLHLDIVLAHKIIRLLRSSLQPPTSTPSGSSGTGGLDPTSSPLYYDAVSVLDRVILPSLSHSEANCCLAEEIWSIIKLYPYQTRYYLYARWKNETYLDHAKLIRKRGEAEKKIKAIMKRVSKENVKPAGRHIGKLSYYCPGYLFDYTLIQVQMYDNLILPVVDSLKYLTPLAYDVLTYCIIETLTHADKDRFKHDGTSLSVWLTNMASFCGNIFKKYHVTLDLTGTLQYIGNQLKQHKSLDLCLLKEIVQKMSGIEVVDDITEDQLQAMSGGELLRNEAASFTSVRNTKRSSAKLKEALCSDNLAVALCLLIAQQKNCVIYQETSRQSHLKLVGKLYDQCQDTLVQYGTFLGSTMTIDEYTSRLPPIQTLLEEYHINIDVAFFITRPMFNHAISIKYDALRKADPNSKKLPTVKQQKYVEAVKEVMGPVIKSVIPLHPAKVWEDIAPEFLVTFWSLTTYDLFVPVEAYTREINKLKMQSLSTIDSKELPAVKIKKESDKFNSLMEKLNDEKKKQQEHVERVMARLNQEKDIWFVSRSPKGAKNETINQFLQLCIFPRCIFTSVDAVFCAKFVHLLHKLKTANFSSLLCYDRLFCDITYVVTLCTENEAHRYGRFLATLLDTIMHWHSSPAIYEAECADHPGFVTKCRVSNQCSDANQNVGYENYRHACHKWHYKITKSIVLCLESKDYVQIRNAFIVLMKILPYFPVLAKLSNFIEKTVNKVREEEKSRRQDLFTIATSYCRFLIAKTPNLMKESDFHDTSDKVKKPAAAATKKEATASASTGDPEAKKPAKAPANGVEKANGVSNVNGKVAVKEEPLTTSSSNTTSVAPSEKQEKQTERRVLNRTSVEVKSEPPVVKKEKDVTSSSGSTTKELKKKLKSQSQDSGQPPEKRHKEHKEKKDKESRKEDSRTIIIKDEHHDLRKRSRSYDKSPTHYTSAERHQQKDYPSPPTPKGFVTVQSPEYGDTSPRYVHSSPPPSYSHSPPPHNDFRELESISNSSSGSLNQLPEIDRPERNTRRRRTDATPKSSKRSEGRGSSEMKKEKREKREKKSSLALFSSEKSAMGKSSIAMYSSEKSTMGKSSAESKDKEGMRKKKLTRKRDRLDEAALIVTEQKKRKEDKLSKSSKSSSHANGDQIEHLRESRMEKHHYSREKSTDDRFSYERETVRHEHERSEKHSRRTGGGDKRR
uniref:THO complex subunit 2 n=1 Tax=Cacopsylla melanoneura TaxID=428564 RepID=A0A8D8ZLW5_9HEMI